MKNIAFLFVTLIYFTGLAQVEPNLNSPKYTAENKGKIYVYWGGNRDFYSKSNIRFQGDGYDFTLHDVKAEDKPKGWHIDYINPLRMTIPQTNLRIGYFISDKYNISLGVDHMKYVMYQDKKVKYSGYYPDRGAYGEDIEDGSILLTEGFLTFEHTDGLNYINFEINRFDDISKIFGMRDTDKIQVNLTEGVGAGILFPKSNTKLLGKDRYDEFHVSGYGLSAKAGLNVTFFKHFFVQTEFKGGYIHMPDIRTTYDKADKASQSFYFGQTILAFGGIFRL